MGDMNWVDLKLVHFTGSEGNAIRCIRLSQYY